LFLSLNLPVFLLSLEISHYSARWIFPDKSATSLWSSVAAMRFTVARQQARILKKPGTYCSSCAETSQLCLDPFGEYHRKAQLSILSNFVKTCCTIHTLCCYISITNEKLLETISKIEKKRQVALLRKLSSYSDMDDMAINVLMTVTSFSWSVLAW